MTIRVALWTTGHIATFAGRAILDDPEMELVGCYAYSPEKAGKDVGELIGVDPIGVLATNSVDEIVALAPDVVAYFSIIRQEDVGWHTEQIARLLEAGINVVSSSNLVTGRWWKAEAIFEEAGRKGGASVYGGGVNPGFINAFALTAASVCSDVQHISIWEEAECSGYNSRELWETVAFGRPVDDPDNAGKFWQGTAVFEDTVAMMADALELPLDDIRYLPEVAVATRDLDLGFMEIPEGHVAGLKNRWVGVADGVEVIELGTVWKMTEDVEPNWEIRHGWHIVVDGMPTVKAHVAGWPPEGESNSEVLMSIAMVMTALPIVNAIPHVVRARPGVVTYKDLPLVTAARRVHPAARP
jgi:2,4-diaminopentanoate dehydrogenase